VAILHAEVRRVASSAVPGTGNHSSPGPYRSSQLRQPNQSLLMVAGTGAPAPAPRFLNPDEDILCREEKVKEDRKRKTC